MKILIAADMEGITGVVNWDHVDPEHHEYDRFRRLMTGDVNAAIWGSLDAGADIVVITDGHAYGNNILIEELDLRATLNASNSSPLAMVQGIDSGIDAVMLVGYHARAGTQNAILDHTWSSKRVANLWLNEIPVGEVGLNAAMCGHFNVPVIMISGDQTVCAEAIELLGPIETAIVKRATGRTSAQCDPPQVTQKRIQEAALKAVSRLIEGENPGPFQLQLPVEVRIQFNTSAQTDKAVLYPNVERLDGRLIQFTTEDMLAAYRGFRAAVALAGT
jgi:D-amino peptidase